MKTRMMFMLALVGIGLQGAAMVSTEDKVYLFSYFSNKSANGRRGEAAGLHLAWSEDGKKWTALNNDQPFLVPSVGKKQLMRDPSICRGPDGVYHLVWTTSWNDRIIGHASSRDLIHWSDQQAIPVMEHEPTAKNCWAPEVTYNADDGLFYIYWATTIPGRHTPAGHRIYATTTKDWKEFSKTRLWYDPGICTIDSALVRDPSTREWLLVSKYGIDNENGNRKASGLNIGLLRVKNLAEGPSAKIGQCITPDWTEGPSPLFVGDSLYVYFDCYNQGRYGAVRSDDHGRTWKNVSNEISFPKGVRHGTALEVPRKLVEQLKASK